MKTITPILTGLMCAGVAFGMGKVETEALSPLTVFTAKKIITMEPAMPEATAVAVADGRIVAVGSLESLKGLIYEREATIDRTLADTILMPGFIEPHLHPLIAAVLLSGDIVAPHDWNVPEEVKKGVEGHDEYIERLKASIAKKGKKGEVLFIWGYHQLWHGDLNRQMLNEIAPDVPVAVLHRSFHEVFINDRAIELFGIKEEDFKGNPQVEWDRGHFFEGGWMAMAPKIAPYMLNPVKYKKGLADMTRLMMQNGITTIAEPGLPNVNFEMEFGLLKSEMDKNPPFTVYNILNGPQLKAVYGSNEKAAEFMEAAVSNNTQNIIILPKQVKLFADGAIYSLAMEMKEPYTDGFKGQWMTPLTDFEE